ncbi:MAG: FHA domain-containing protein [Polyangiaceae bacterium]
MAAHWIRFKGTHFPVRREETVIGRSAYCTIVLSNELASRQHCALKAESEGLMVTDLGSRNGTYVNGERIDGSHLLKPGDLIRIGSDVLEVLDSDTPTRKASTQTSRVAPDDAGFEDGTTRTNVDLLEFIEGLSSVAGSFPVEPTAMAIEHALDSLLQRHVGGGEGLTRSQTNRLMAVIQRVESWFPDGARLGWAEEARRRLDEVSHA